MWKQWISKLGSRQIDLPMHIVGQHLPANREVWTLEVLAEQANIVLECEYDYGPDAFERSPERSPLDLLRLLYAHCWSHQFASALHELTGWPVVTASNSAGRSIHHLNRHSEGKLIDVTGFVGLEELQSRYGIPDLVIFEDLGFKRDPKLDDDWMAEVMTAMLYLPHEPFLNMRPVIELWVRHGRIGKEGSWRWQQGEG